VFIVAPDKKQAGIIFKYCKAMIADNFKDMIVRDTTELISLKNGIDIVIMPARMTGLRGFSTICVILDEIAFLKTEDYANPADEIITALEPSLKAKAKLIGISTPYGKFGYFYDMFKEHYGKRGSEILVWQAPTTYMNPRYDVSKIRRAKRRDLSKATAEYEATFREDVSSYISEDELLGLTEFGIKERLPEEDMPYYAFVDVSGARKDSFTFAIAHVEEDFVVLDVIYEKVPPYNIENQQQICADYLKKFGIRHIVGDKYGGDFPVQGFKRKEIQYYQSQNPKSDLYLDFQIVCNLKKVKLLDNERMRKQFIILERKTDASGKDSVIKPRNTHDDVANSVAGAVVMAYRSISTRPSEEELKSRMFRKVHKRGLNYDEEWANILKEAEKEMEEQLARRKKGEGEK